MFSLLSFITDAVDPTENISGDDTNRRHPTHQQRKRRRQHEDEVVYGDCVAQIVGGEKVDNLTNFCSPLSFRTYVSHLQWKPSVVRPVATGEIDIMIENTSRMVACLTETDVNHGILQHLKLARHIEVVAEHQNRHSYSVVNEICGEANGDSCLSFRYAKRVLKTSYAVYRYPLLSEVEATWSNASYFLPAIADLFDSLILENQSPPANIITAQEERHKVIFFLNVFGRPQKHKILICAEC